VRRVSACLVLAFAAVMGGASLAGAATARDWRAEEARYRQQYPKFMRVAEKRVPYSKPFLRVIYFVGGVGTYYGHSRNRDVACAWAKQDHARFDQSAARQLFSTQKDYAELRRQKVSKYAVVLAYRRGAVVGCSLPR
jgi:hypothetical protein